MYIKQNIRTEIIPDNNEGNSDFKINTSKEKEAKEINDINDINIIGKIESSPIHTLYLMHQNGHNKKAPQFH